MEQAQRRQKRVSRERTGQGPLPHPLQVCRLPCASSGSRAGRLEPRQATMRWGRGPEEEAIRERYQGLQGGCNHAPASPTAGAHARSPQGSPMEASESALGTMKRKVDDTSHPPLVLLSLASNNGRQAATKTKKGISSTKAIEQLNY